jgi:hypothetical protein
MPGGITGLPVPGRNKYRNLALQVGRAPKIETTQIWEGCAGDVWQKLKSTGPTSRQRGRPTIAKVWEEHAASEDMEICHEDGSSIFLRNFRNDLPDCMVSHTKAVIFNQYVCVCVCVCGCLCVCVCVCVCIYIYIYIYKL